MKILSKKTSIFLVISLVILGNVPLFGQVNRLPTRPVDSCLVDAGGHKLHLNVQGRGNPTVILENGSADFSFIWSLVQPEVAKFTRVVSYDRAGYAWSEPGPIPRTGKQICFELHTALQNLGITGPYILVGQSFGGFLVRYFAMYYPKEVAGMILIDAIQENQPIFMGGDSPKLIREFAKGREMPPIISNYKPASGNAKEETLKLDSNLDYPLTKLPASIQQLQIIAQAQPEYRSAVMAEMDWSPEDVNELYKHQGQPEYLLGNKPLIVITRGKGGYDGRKDSLALETERLQAQKKLTGLSTNSKQIIDLKSGHNIHLEDPQTVIKAIKEILNVCLYDLKLK